MGQLTNTLAVLAIGIDASGVLSALWAWALSHPLTLTTFISLTAAALAVGLVARIWYLLTVPGRRSKRTGTRATL